MTKIVYMNLPYSVRKYLTKIPAEVTFQDILSLRIQDEAMGLCTKRLLKW
jgi:hypothetical protein